MPPTDNFEPQSFENGWRYEDTNYWIEVPTNGITFLPNIMKIYQVVQKL
jgi:hypothetical protein